jgi:glycosyltransferase involved in cell wall biosynthesis
MILSPSLPFLSNAFWSTPVATAWMVIAARVTFASSLLAAVLFACNVLLFRRPGPDWNKRLLPPVSVLIPARNEEASIEAAVRSVLSSRGVNLELIVLDDGSTDSTAEILYALAEEDSRLRIEPALPMPAGWNGKQHACWALASLAKHDVLCYVDADVVLGSEAIYRMVSELNIVTGDKPEIALVSGFPRQITETFLEKLLLPLIHFVLLCFLPLVGERWTRWPAFAAGCGQFMMVRREPYFATGGHSTNPMTMHDGLLLAKLFRSQGFRTRVFDLTRDAACRMYTSAGQVWNGLVKNATEGMATLIRLPVFTVLLFFGQVTPIAIIVWAYAEQYKVPYNLALLSWQLAVMSLLLDLIVRFVSLWRYQQNWKSAALHPLGVLLLLLLQWYALLRMLFRRPVVWKERKYPVG